MSLRAALLGVFIILASVSFARADGGRIPIWESTWISVPGHYVVTRDIAGSGNVITIGSTDVVLDLNGHTITATSSSGVGIVVALYGSDPGVIEIRNGRLRGGIYSVWHSDDLLTSKTRIRLEGLDISTGGTLPVNIVGAPIVEIVRCSVHDIPGAASAIHVEAGFSGSFTGVIAENVVSAAVGGGIRLFGMRGGAVRNNVLTNFGTGGTGDGIGIDGNWTRLGGVLVAENTIQSGIAESSAAIRIGGQSHRNSVIRNVIESSSAGIIVYSNGNRIAGNVIGGTSTHGILLYGSDSTITENVVESGGYNGVSVVGANNLIDDNSIEGHGNCGLAFFPESTNNAYRGNMLRNNLFAAVCGQATDAGENIP